MAGRGGDRPRPTAAVRSQVIHLVRSRRKESRVDASDGTLSVGRPFPLQQPAGLAVFPVEAYLVPQFDAGQADDLVVL